MIGGEPNRFILGNLRTLKLALQKLGPRLPNEHPSKDPIKFCAESSTDLQILMSPSSANPEKERKKNELKVKIPDRLACWKSIHEALCGIYIPKGLHSMESCQEIREAVFHIQSCLDQLPD